MPPIFAFRKKFHNLFKLVWAASATKHSSHREVRHTALYTHKSISRRNDVNHHPPPSDYHRLASYICCPPTHSYMADSVANNAVNIGDVAVGGFATILEVTGWLYKTWIKPRLPCSRLEALAITFTNVRALVRDRDHDTFRLNQLAKRRISLLRQAKQAASRTLLLIRFIPIAYGDIQRKCDKLDEDVRQFLSHLLGQRSSAPPYATARLQPPTLTYPPPPPPPNTFSSSATLSSVATHSSIDTSSASSTNQMAVEVIPPSPPRRGSSEDMYR
ncbi:hypothetical protein C2E23DRAFT_38980 [Lenzites betulinus]|nr:hypothetical protein C2E23DRAFT_38980 [Lenzites betulinus]